MIGNTVFTRDDIVGIKYTVSLRNGTDITGPITIDDFISLVNKQQQASEEVIILTPPADNPSAFSFPDEESKHVYENN